MCPSTTLHTSSIPLKLSLSSSAAGTRQRSNQNQIRAVLHLAFYGDSLIAGAGEGPLPNPVAATGSLQNSPLLVLFRLRVGKLGFYLDRVDVGVEVSHDGKDDAHHHQQRGEEDVLSPLVNRNTHHQTLHGLLWLLFKVSSSPSAMFYLKQFSSERMFLPTESTHLFLQRSSLGDYEHDNVANSNS